MKHGRRTRLTIAAIIAVLSGVTAFVLTVAVPWLGQLELRAFDANARTAFRARANPEIVVVGIADDTFAALGVSPPRVPRRFHARLIEGLKRAGAKVVVFDLFFIGDTSKQDDAPLQEAIDGSGPLGIVLSLEDSLHQRDEAAPSGYRWTFRDIHLKVGGRRGTELAMAIPYAPDHVLRGFYSVLPDWNYDPPRPTVHAALSAFALASGRSSSDYTLDRARRELSLGELHWKLGPDGELETRFLADNEDFASYEFAQALSLLRDRSKWELFGGKTVLVGMINGEDDQMTPLGKIPGVVFLAQSLNGMIDAAARPLIRCSDIVAIGLSTLLAFLAAWAVLPTRWLRTTSLLGVGLLTLLGSPHWALDVRGWWMPTVMPACAFLLALTLGGLVEAARSGRLADRFVPSFIRKGMRADLPEMAAILFVDIQGSTRLLNLLGADRGRKLFSDVLARLTAVIQEGGGEVHSTQGDGLMAIFREPERPDYALSAVQSIDLMQQAIKDLAQDLRRDFDEPLRLTFGLEAGDVTGRITEAQLREEWGLFGIAIHLAARLQVECGARGVDVLIGPALANIVGSQLSLRPLEPFTPKGFASPVVPYTIDTRRNPQEAALN